MTRLTTTLNRIRARRPCESCWTNLLAGLGKTAADDEPLAFATILRINGLNDALWCCRAEPQHAREWRLFAIWCTRRVRHLMADARSIAALDTAEHHASGLATDEELSAAGAAAGVAAWDAARDAAWAAAGAAARDAAWAVAGVAAWDPALAVEQAAAGEAAWAAERDAQAAEFLRVVGRE